jgi:hypothetical protein
MSLATLKRPRRPQGSQTIVSVGARMSARVKWLAKHLVGGAAESERREHGGNRVEGGAL